MQACKNDKMLGYSLVAVGLCKFVPIYHNTIVHRLCFLQDKQYLVIFTEYDVIKNGELFIHWFEGDVPVSDMRLCRKPLVKKVQAYQVYVRLTCFTCTQLSQHIY